MLRSPFFRRLFLPYLLLICLATGIVGMVGASRLRTSYLEQTTRSQRHYTDLIAKLIDADMRAGRVAEVSRTVREVGHAIQRRVTVIAGDGAVIADNEADAVQMDNHRLRPEIAAAAADGQGESRRESGTLHEGLMYFASRIDSGVPAVEPYYIRVSAHLRELDRHLHSLYAALAAASLLATTAAGVLCFHFARRSSAPVVRLTRFANALAQGNLTERLPRVGGGEIGTLAAALNTMADSLGRLISQAAKDRSELRAILSGMTEGVLAIDKQQKILLVNTAAGNLLGFSTEQARGRRMSEVVRSQLLLDGIGDALNENRRTTIKVGPVLGRHLEITTCPLPPERSAGVVLVVHDATESVRYQELRKEFVANVSHELRTPLTAIKGYAETLRDGAMQDPVRCSQYLAIIEKHADQLTNLIADLLDLSRLDDNRGLRVCVALDIAAVVRRAVDSYLPMAERKRQTLQVSLAADLPQIVGNPDDLERAINNLLENAIKYTPEGGRVSTSVSVDQATLCVRVTDNGIGIPAEDLPRIFERFYRVDRSRSREMGGTGLGLSIVKHVAQVHGGSVQVSSTPDHGSEFTLHLPLPTRP